MSGPTEYIHYNAYLNSGVGMGYAATYSNTGSELILLKLTLNSE